MMTIGILGYGVIGSALGETAKQKGFQVVVWDKYKDGFNTFLQLTKCGLVFACLPTLTNDETGEQDLSAVIDGLNKLDKAFYKGVVALRSTVLPGTTNKLKKMFPNLKITHNPEFITEANARMDMLHQPAVLVGGDHWLELSEFWTKFDNSSTFYRFMDPTVTELAKYTHNCFLAVKVSFFNDVYAICQKMNVDFDQVRTAALAMDKIGTNHTKVPGPDGKRGYGGMCFPKDTIALKTWAKKELDLLLPTLTGAMVSNELSRGEG